MRKSEGQLCLLGLSPGALSKDPGGAGGGEGTGVCVCTEAKDGNSGSCLLRGFRCVVLFSGWSWGHRYQNHGGWIFIQLAPSSLTWSLGEGPGDMGWPLHTVWCEKHWHGIRWFWTPACLCLRANSTMPGQVPSLEAEQPSLGFLCL